MRGRFAWIAALPAWQVPFWAIGCAAVVFGVCIVIEKVRLLVFRVLRLDYFAVQLVKMVWGRVSSELET